jgi:hypothetical protein
MSVPFRNIPTREQKQIPLLHGRIGMTGTGGGTAAVAQALAACGSLFEGTAAGRKGPRYKPLTRHARS